MKPNIYTIEQALKYLDAHDPSSDALPDIFELPRSEYRWLGDIDTRGNPNA